MGTEDKKCNFWNGHNWSEWQNHKVQDKYIYGEGKVDFVTQERFCKSCKKLEVLCEKIEMKQSK